MQLYSRVFFTKLLYSHVRREGNKLAHNLVRHSLNVTYYVAWIKDVPPPSFSVMQVDLANL